MNEENIMNSKNENEEMDINSDSDVYINNKYLSDKEDNIKNLNNNNKTETNEKNYEIKKKEIEESPLKIKNKLSDIENLPLKIDLDKEKEKEKGNIHNLVINDSPIKSSNDSLIENYIKMENLYLQDGKVNSSITNSKFNTINLTPNFIDSKRNSKINQRNEEKFKLLQNELAKKIGKNINDEIQNFEIDDNNYSDINFSSNKDSSESFKEFNESSELRQKRRNEKENKIKEKISNDLRPKLHNEIYKKEYKKIYNKIKKEIENEIKDKLNIYYNEEISDFKKKQKIILMDKEKELGNKMREQCENELEKELLKEMQFKERENKIKFNQKLASFRKKIDTELNNKYEKEKKKIEKEINEIKSQIYRVKCKEKLKINKINALKKNIKTFNDINNKNVENLDKKINSKDLEDEKIIPLNNQILKNKIEKNSSSKGQSFIHLLNNNSYSTNLINLNQLNKQLDDILINSFEKIDNNYKKNKLLRNPSNNSVNLKEINNQIKLNSGRSFKSFSNRKVLSNDNKINKMIQSQKFEQDSISPIHSNANLLNNNIKEIDNYTQTINVSKEISPIITKDNSINIKNKPIVKKNEDDSKKIFYSIQIDKHVPISISGFGKYLIEHIEREEKYKLLYNNELKSFQSKIEKIFENIKGKDHYLTDYMIELWNKLQTSYFTRYEIMKQIINLHPSNLYNFLDRETEYLINYYKISEKIFSDIQKRENLKLKLQIQANRNDIKVNDHKKFNEITILLENSISEFKKKFTNVDIIWKGLRYQWFMNYENWFYEMENLSKNN